MKLVLLSGGSGKRLWPLSNDARSKQFLKVLNGDKGQRESMVQRVWRQLESVGLADSAVVAIGKAQVDMIHNQLSPAVRAIVEPERRDTFPAIALAVAYLYSVEGVGLNETVVVMPVDPYVENTFFETVQDLEQALEVSGAELALIGVNPTYPSEKYGYIVPKKGQASEIIKVDHFVEKPSERMAKELIGERALWNCGVFAFKLGKIISLLKMRGLPTDYNELLTNYAKLPKISFDYEVVEKAEEIVAIRYSGYWKDLGTWNTLTEEMAEKVMGKGMISPDCENTHLVNELDIPVTVLGLSNIVVATSPDGILVADKSASPKIKELMRDFEQRPMYEERRWGWYKVLDHTKFENGTEMLTKRIGVQAGRNLSYQVHLKRTEVWTIVRGEGEFVQDGVIYPVQAGDVLKIGAGVKHGVRAISDLEFIEVQTGNELVEEDIRRIYMGWDDVVRHCC